MLTPDELRTLAWLTAIGLTIGAFIVIIVFGIACALSGMSGLDDQQPDEGVDDLQAALDATQDQPAASAANLHPALRASGYYASPAHQARAARVDRAMGGSDAA